MDSGRVAECYTPAKEEEEKKVATEAIYSLEIVVLQSDCLVHRELGGQKSKR